MLTLTDVVDDILPAGTRHVGGPAVTSVPVNRVVILAEDDQPVVDRATLAVAGPATAIDTDDLLSSAPAALVIPSGHAVAASPVDYPVLMLPPGAAPADITDLVAGRLRGQQEHLAIQGIDVYRRLAELAIAGKGIADIAAAVAVSLALPVAVADEEWRPLYAFDVDGLEIAEPGDAILRGLREKAAPAFGRERLSSSAPPVLHVALAGEPHTYVVAPVVLPAGPSAYIWADGAAADLSSLVDVTISHAAAVCAIDMARQQAVLEAQLHLRGNFVEELLTDGYQSVDAMRQRARFLGHVLDQPHTVAVFDIDHFARYTTARPVSGEGAIVKLKERFTRLVADALTDGDQALLWQYSDAVVALLPVQAETSVADVEKRIEAVRATVQARLGGPTISVGIGRVYDDPTRLHRSYTEAREAVGIGLATVGPAHTTPFDRLGVYRLLFRLRESPELESFRDELLGPLETYDAARGADLVYTLERYLACNCNVARATEELHLHRNGLLYRLQRIGEITGADFNDAQQRLSYHLALLARSLTGD